MSVGNVVSGSVGEIATVAVEKKSQNIEKQKGAALVSLIDQSGPRSRPPPEGSTVSVIA